MRKLCIIFIVFCFGLAACGGRTDIDTEHGRQAIIDDTHLYLSAGNCQLALQSIDPLYTSAYVNDEIRVLRSNVDACFAGFSTLTLLVNLVEKSNVFVALAKTAQNTLNDGKITAYYRAVDILTQSGNKLSAAQRSKTINDFMVFLQLGLLGAILDAYGLGSTEGVQSATLDYLPAAAGTMSNTDGCAFAAAHSFVSDSFNNSNLTSNAQAVSAVTTLNARCQAAGLGSCSSINRDRSLCDGANAASLAADALAGAVDSAW